MLNLKNSFMAFALLTTASSGAYAAENRVLTPKFNGVEFNIYCNTDFEKDGTPRMDFLERLDAHFHSNDISTVHFLRLPKNEAQEIIDGVQHPFAKTWLINQYEGFHKYTDLNHQRDFVQWIIKDHGIPYYGTDSNKADFYDQAWSRCIK